MNEQNLMGQISNCLVKGRFEACVQHRDSGEKKRLGVPELIRLSMKKDVPPPVVAEEALDNAMEESIEKYVDGEFTLPDMIVRAKSTAKARDVLSEYTSDSKSFPKGKAVLATVDGQDYTHWQGFTVNILKGLGYYTIDLGSGASAKDVVRSVKNEDPDILGITPSSTSLIPEFNAVSSISSKRKIKQVIDNLSEEGYRDNVTILIGGNAPVIHSADEVGADYCCMNLLQTVKLLKKLACSSKTFRSGAFALNPA
ncbi:MAG: cobalamin-dependent protein [Deltaproteobacteria bacterium]|jgi:5-methyltetrahydrofolate--homocysteine methyltransferase|nr:cobalamin-dependent protein [Deltaproteobacteria bacterium]